MYSFDSFRLFPCTGSMKSSRLLYAYMIFYGAAALWITREHFSVGDWIGTKVIKDSRLRHFYRFCLEMLSLVFILIFFYYSFRLTMLAQDVTNVFAIPKKVLYSCLPVSGAIMTISSIRHILGELIGMTESQGEA